MADASDRPLRVVHIITRLIVGGAQENTLLTCEGLHDRGHEVTLLSGPSLGPEGTLEDRARSHGYRFETIDPLRRSILPRKDWASYHALRHRIAELKPDVVHTHSSKAGIIGRLAAWDEHVPHVIHTVHGLSFTASTRRVVNAAYIQLERLAAKRCHTIVGVADAMNREMLDRHIGTADQYETVYSGMDTRAFVEATREREATRSDLGLAADDVAVVTVARLFDMKGHDDLLAAAPKLCENPNIKFVWVGDGSRRGDFEQEIERLGLKDRFILVGLVDPAAVPNYVAASDVLAHPSRREGLARALPQAALCGLPVVCYDIDGNIEGLVQGESGYAVAAFDTAAFTDRVGELVSDAGKRQQMGGIGQQFATERFAKETMVDALERIYRKRP